MTHQSHGHNQAVAADLRDHAQRRINAQTQQLKGTALRQVLLIQAFKRGDHLCGAGITQQLQQQANGLRQRHQCGCPALQILLASLCVQVLPRVVGRQVKLAGASRNTHAASDAHQPVVFQQRMPRFAGQRINI